MDVQNYVKISKLSTPKPKYTNPDSTHVRQTFSRSDGTAVTQITMTHAEARQHILDLEAKLPEPTPEPDPVPDPDPLPEPTVPSSVLWGGRIGYPGMTDYPWGPTTLSKFEASAGKQVSYVQFGQPLGRFDKAAMDACKAAGIVPHMEFMLKAASTDKGTQIDPKGGTSWLVTEAANGLLDDRMRTVFQAMKDWGGYGIIRPHWEPNGPWMDTYYGYCTSMVHSNPDAYVAMWRRWRAIFKQVFAGISNPPIKWLWCVNWWNAQQSGAKNPTPWFPGQDDQVDLVGLNGYADYATIDTILGGCLPTIQTLAPGKKIYWETGVCKSGGNNHPPPAGMTPEAWVADVFAKLPNYPVRVFQWFQDSEGTRDSTAIEQSAAVLNAFKTGIANSRYLAQAEPV